LLADRQLGLDLHLPVGERNTAGELERHKELLVYETLQKLHGPESSGEELSVVPWSGPSKSIFGDVMVGYMMSLQMKEQRRWYSGWCKKCIGVGGGKYKRPDDEDT
jgi:hypothetical protein